MTRLRLTLCLLLLLPASASADVENDLGLNPRTAALGGAVGATGGDFAAANYNVGALIVPTDENGLAEIGASFVLAAPALYATDLDGNALIDADGDPLLVAPSNTYALTLGGRFDVGQAFDVPGLVLGFSLYAPVEGLVQSRIRPDDALQWLQLTDRTLHISLNIALAYRIVDWLSIGVGVRVTFDEEAFITGTATDIERVVDPETGEERVVAGTRLGVETAIYGRPGPLVGILLSPLPQLRFGLAWRGELYSDDWGWSRLQDIPGVGDIGFVHRFAHVFRPHELSLSAAWQVQPALRVSADLTWAMWSLGVSPTSTPLVGRFGDVLIPAFGLRYTAADGVQLMAGYRYQHAYFDAQGGPENLMMNDTHNVGLGIDVDLDALITGETVPFTLSLAGRLAILEDREEVKNGRRFSSDAALRANPGYPGYRYGGVVPSVQLGVEARW